MKSSLVLSTAWRESRGARGRLVFFTLSLALGVAALTGVSALVGAVDAALFEQSRELLGADLAVESRQPIPAEIDRYFASTGPIERIDVRELATVASGGSGSRLVELVAVGPGHPFHGTIALDPPGRLDDFLGPDRCVVAPEVLADLDLALGDELSIGGEPFTIAATVTDEPGRLDIGMTLGPRAFLSLDGLARTTLESFGSRVEHRALYRLSRDVEREELREIRDRIDEEVPEAPYLRIQSHRDAQRTVRRGLERVERYLGLVALLSLILGGTGVAQIVRAWLASRTQSVAVMRVIGFRPQEVLVLYLGHVALLAFVASAIGALAGSLVPPALPLFAADLLPESLEVAWTPRALARGIGLGVGIALVFSAPPLTAIWRVAPARVLRVDAEPLAAPRVVSVTASALLVLGVLAAAWTQSEDLVLAASFTGGVAVAAGVLALAARALVALAARVPRRGLGPYLRHGIAALARPGAAMRGAMVALGLGVLVVASLAWIEERLAERLRTALPADAPSVFLVDVQPDQWAAIEGHLVELGASSIRSVPVLMARLAAIDGVDVAELSERRRDGRPGGGRSRWTLTREQRLTWADSLADDNQIVAGALWSDPEHAEVSLEQDFAEDLGAPLGTRLRFDVQGVPVELTVTSLRSVEWESFGINFFLVAELGVLEEAPHFLLAAARLPPEAEMVLQDRLAADVPNVTPIRVRAILEKVLGILSRLATAVRLLGAFTILTGLAILAGVASASAADRGREVAILKTLGLTRGGVTRLLAVEYALVGLVAGSIGALAALALSWAFLEHVVELDASLPVAGVPAAALATAVLCAVSGLLASTRALARAPIESLRS